MVVVIWCHQATAQVMGGLRSTLMLARYANCLFVYCADAAVGQ